MNCVEIIMNNNNNEYIFENIDLNNYIVNLIKYI